LSELSQAEPAGSGQDGDVERRGLLLVMSSPSGAGKTTLARRLLASDAQITMSVSVTTRAPRPGEVDGKDYIFVDERRFYAMRDGGELLEWARVFGNLYATPRAQVERLVSSGRDVLFDIDWQGAQQLAEQMPDDVVRVFILPPSGAALEERLRLRNQDSPEVVKARMTGAAAEIVHWDEYDYVIVNADVDASFSSVQAVLSAERVRRTRQTGLNGFVGGLLERL